MRSKTNIAESCCMVLFQYAKITPRFSKYHREFRFLLLWIIFLFFLNITLNTSLYAFHFSSFESKKSEIFTSVIKVKEEFNFEYYVSFDNLFRKINSEDFNKNPWYIKCFFYFIIYSIPSSKKICFFLFLLFMLITILIMLIKTSGIKLFRRHAFLQLTWKQLLLEKVVQTALPVTLVFFFSLWSFEMLYHAVSDRKLLLLPFAKILGPFIFFLEKVFLMIKEAKASEDHFKQHYKNKYL